MMGASIQQTKQSVGRGRRQTPATAHIRWIHDSEAGEAGCGTRHHSPAGPCDVVMILETFLMTWGMSMDGNRNEMTADWQAAR